MKFIIHYDGRYEDELVVEGETIEEIREKADIGTKRRGWKYQHCWSEKQ